MRKAEIKELCEEIIIEVVVLKRAILVHACDKSQATKVSDAFETTFRLVARPIAAERSNATNDNFCFIWLKGHQTKKLIDFYVLICSSVNFFLSF